MVAKTSAKCYRFYVAGTRPCPGDGTPARTPWRHSHGCQTKTYGTAYASGGYRRRVQVRPTASREGLPDSREGQYPALFALHRQRPQTGLHRGFAQPLEAPPPRVLPSEQGEDWPRSGHCRRPHPAAGGPQASAGGICPDRAGEETPIEAVKYLVIIPVRIYQLTISPWLPRACRYEPSCSNYMLEAVRKHGAMKGTWMGLRRLLRCAPWGGHGFDPVP